MIAWTGEESDIWYFHNWEHNLLTLKKKITAFCAWPQVPDFEFFENRDGVLSLLHPVLPNHILIDTQEVVNLVFGEQQNSFQRRENLRKLPCIYGWKRETPTFIRQSPKVKSIDPSVYFTSWFNYHSHQVLLSAVLMIKDLFKMLNLTIPLGEGETEKDAAYTWSSPCSDIKSKGLKTGLFLFFFLFDPFFFFITAHAMEDLEWIMKNEFRLGLY